MPFRILFPVLALAAFLSGCSKQPSNALVIGMELAYPPFEMTDTQNRPTGVSVDLAKALGEHLNRPVVIENIPFAGLIPALQTKKIDLILSSMTATEERAKSIAFSDPYLSTGLCLLLSKSAPANQIEDLDRDGIKIAVKQGTTGHLYANQHFKRAQILIFDKESAAVLEVSQGKVHAFVYDQMSTFKNWQRHPDTTRAMLTPFQSESWAIGLRQSDTQLQTQINEFLAVFKKQGGFYQLGERYLKEQKEAFEKLGVPFYF